MAGQAFGWGKDKSEGFVCYFYFISFWHWSLGLSFWPVGPNIEVHLPFGFIRFGFVGDAIDAGEMSNSEAIARHIDALVKLLQNEPDAIVDPVLDHLLERINRSRVRKLLGQLK